MNNEYLSHGYLVLKNVFSEDDLGELHDALLVFHDNWRKDNDQHYSDGAVNSAYITGTKYLDEDKRLVLFKFLGSRKFMDIVEDVFPSSPAFMNTQLFFNPVDKAQRNYWHRDIQYKDSSIEEQKIALKKINVIHFRVPLSHERGVELVPGTHSRWDRENEFDIRMEQHGHKSFEDLVTGKQIELNRGDLLVFSANMIHRGLYGMDRLAFDILFCDSDPELVDFAVDDCLPDNSVLRAVEVPTAFRSTISLRKYSK